MMMKVKLPPRIRLRFRIRALLLLVALAGMGLGGWKMWKRREYCLERIAALSASRSSWEAMVKDNVKFMDEKIGTVEKYERLAEETKESDPEDSARWGE